MTKRIHVCVLGEEHTLPEQFISSLIGQDYNFLSQYTANIEYITFIEQPKVTKMRLYKVHDFAEIHPYVIKQIFVPTIPYFGNRNYNLSITFVPDPLFYKTSEAEQLLDEIKADFFVQLINLDNRPVPTKYEKIVSEAIKKKKHLYVLTNYNKDSDFILHQYIRVLEQLNDTNIVKVTEFTQSGMEELYDELKYYLSKI